MENCNSSDDQISKATFDPGWNDPPKFTYSAQQTTPNRPRNFLNKRVAFPLSGTGVAVATPPPANVPPMPVCFPPAPPVHINPTITLQEEGFNIDSENTLQEVKDILLTFLENSTELGPKANDIKRRINIMEEMWNNGKLNKRIHLQMKDLAYALRDDQPSRADDIHRALMVDYVNSVGSWMPGVKQLVHHCIARSELLNLDKEC